MSEDKPKRKIKYDPEALLRNMERCDKNIAAFQEAIQKEEVIKAELKRLFIEANEE